MMITNPLLVSESQSLSLAYAVMLEDGNIVMNDKLEVYFREYANAYTPRHLSATAYDTLEDVEVYLDRVVLLYSIDASVCGDCERESVFSGRCEHDPLEVTVELSPVDVYY